MESVKLVVVGVLTAFMVSGVLSLVYVSPTTGESMEPTISGGDVIIGHTVDTDTLEEGDVISFTQDSGRVLTHRIVEVYPDGRIRTQGDNNTRDDPVIEPSQVNAKIVWVI